MTLERPLQEAIARALSLLRRSGLRGSFGGGVAVIVWGQPRVTQDLDLLLEIGTEQVDGFLELARAAGYRTEDNPRELLEGGFLRLLPPADAAPVALDLLRADTELHLQAIGRTRTFQLAGEAVPVLAPEDLILLKLVAFRPKDTFDLESVIAATRETLDTGYLRRWSDQLGLRDRLEAFLSEG